LHNIKPAKSELVLRLNRFCNEMDSHCPDWDTAVIVSRVNQYYFTGTIQDAVLFIKKNRTIYYFTRRSYERALEESAYSSDGRIFRMESYRDAADTIGRKLGNLYIESEVMTCAVLNRLKRHFSFEKLGSLDRAVMKIRAIKSPYELSLMEEAGRRHHDFLLNTVPSLLSEGISEAEFVGRLYSEMMKKGHHGLTRFFMFQTEMGIGQVAFGESSLYPTAFDGPGGSYGMSAAVPLVGSYNRTLKKGDLVFVDIGFGMNGYHSDKTQVYIFGTEPSEEFIEEHRLCMRIQKAVAEQLKPGNIHSEIYRSVMESLTDRERKNLGGFGKRQVKFLGHGIGLQVDEYPVIAEGFDKPLTENMTLAIEPKKGITGLGTVGVEDTFVVTPDGGRCITGHCSDIITV